MENQSSLSADKHKRLTVKTNIIAIIMFVLLTLADQLSKRLAFQFLRADDRELIPGVLELHYLENKGAAWGILQDRTWLLIIITAVVMVMILFAYFHLPAAKKFHLLRFCLVLLAAGAFGNFIDRILNHYVIDFIYFSLIDFPVFNVADCFVCIAAALILYCLIFKYKDEDFNVKGKEISHETDY